jgi:hypothetical protein
VGGIRNEEARTQGKESGESCEHRCAKKRNNNLGTSMPRRKLNRMQKHLELEIGFMIQNLSISWRRERSNRFPCPTIDVSDVELW